jgi:HD-GYP domain-containing protein (c-di-GMP phosphodiesterase class II)
MKKNDCLDPETDLAALRVGAAKLVTGILEEKDVLLKAHGERVANLCANFCEAHDLLRGDELLNLYLAALLHDIGCLSLPVAFSQGSGPVASEQEPLMKKHPVTGVGILSNFPGFNAILPAVQQHHEFFDGSGYPDGKRAGEIPLEARIICLFDTYDQLTSGIEGARKLAPQEALTEVKSRSGKEFDPALVPKMLEFFKSSPNPAQDYLMNKEAAAVKQIFSDVMQQFTSGKVTPPAMPQVVHQVRTIIKRVDSSVKDVGDVIEKDPVISLRLISVAKSPVYKGYGDVKSVQAAIPRLGFKETLSIVVTIASKSLYEAKQPEHRALMDKMWGHSLASAYAAKLIAQGLFLDDPESFYLMGLIHDVGKVILLRAFADTSSETKISSDVLIAAIQEAHQGVGRALIKRWGFGEEYGKVVALHDASEFAAETPKEVLVVHLANHLTRKMGLSLFKWDGQDLAELPSAKILGAAAAMLERVEEKVRETVKEAAHLF